MRKNSGGKQYQLRDTAGKDVLASLDQFDGKVPKYLEDGR